MHRASKRQGTLATFVAWHREWNDNLGIWELDREMKTLQRTLDEVQEQIIEKKLKCYVIDAYRVAKEAP